MLVTMEAYKKVLNSGEYGTIQCKLEKTNIDGLFDGIKEINMADKSSFFKGKNFVLSGFDSFTEPPIRSVIEDNGGIVRSSTVLDTDYLIYDERFGVGTKKHERAIELNNTKGKNIKIIELKDFVGMVKSGKFDI